MPDQPTVVLRDSSDRSPVARFYYGLDVLDALRLLPDGSVHMIATSPPYWNLRDYGTGSWEGGNDPYCDHKVDSQSAAMKQKRSTLGPKRDGLDNGNAAFQAVDEVYKQVCAKCGAHRVDDQIGVEQTPTEYVAHLVEVFREARRVLRGDGTLWLNLGDSFAGSGKGAWNRDDRQKEVYVPGVAGAKIVAQTPGLKPKDLVGIPWEVAFALRADGWYLRQDIIWHKPRTMPESVTDRCTKAHEYIFLLTKSERYFYDYIAIKEPSIYAGTTVKYDASKYLGEDGKNLPGHETHVTGDREVGTTRNRRSVWSINPQGYPGAHFAVWPEDLVEIMVLAGTSEKGCCPTCGAPWRRIVEYSGGRDWRQDEMKAVGIPGELAGEDSYKRGQSSSPLNDTRIVTMIGWEPTCECPEHEPVRCTVMDIFSGSGTTAAVAMRLGRDAIGIDLNVEYLPLARRRVEGLPESRPKKGAEVLEHANPFDLLADFDADFGDDEMSSMAEFPPPASSPAEEVPE